MKRVGTVVGQAQSVAVIRSPDESYPSIGSTVVDEQLETVGRVVDIFGPVDRPYLAVSPERDSIATLVGSVLYSRD